MVAVELCAVLLEVRGACKRSFKRSVILPVIVEECTSKERNCSDICDSFLAAGGEGAAAAAPRVAPVEVHTQLQ